MIEKGDIYYTDLSPVCGEEVGGIRPCRIVEVFSEKLVRVIPRIMDTQSPSGWRFANEHARTIDTKRLKEKIG